MSPELTKLFQPGSIGRMEVPNRIVMPAMAAGIRGFELLSLACRSSRFFSKVV